MAKLLIADRDHNEGTGIRWLISSYSIPYDEVLLAESVDDLFYKMNRYMPEVLCVELDMIPHEKWSSFTTLVRQSSKEVISMTAESTFERAMQAIELQTRTLWVRPVSPDEIRRTLFNAYRTVTNQSAPDHVSTQPHQGDSSYHSLFLDSHDSPNHETVLLLQPEVTGDIEDLLEHVNHFSFFEKPSVFPLSDMVACIYSSPKEGNSQSIYMEALRLLRTWEENHSDPIVIVLLTNNQDMTLHQKYREARQALELRFFKGHRQVLRIDEPVNWRAIDPFLSPSEQRVWVDLLQQFDRKTIKEWMYDEFLSLKEPYPDPGLLRIRLTSILAQVRRFMTTYHLDHEPFESHYHNVFESILYQPILYRIVQDMLLFIYDLLEGANVHNEQANVDVIERALQYIDRNYHQKALSLNDVAGAVDRSPAYMSHLFTKKLGISFRQQLLNTRIREAKQLLRDPIATIQEVADQVGFGSANYFSRQFRKSTGMSPKTFRNLKK